MRVQIGCTNLIWISSVIATKDQKLGTSFLFRQDKGLEVLAVLNAILARC